MSKIKAYFCLPAVKILGIFSIFSTDKMIVDVVYKFKNCSDFKS